MTENIQVYLKYIANISNISDSQIKLLYELVNSNLEKLLEILSVMALAHIRYIPASKLEIEKILVDYKEKQLLNHK